jgi:PEP-CTERM motif
MKTRTTLAPMLRLTVCLLALALPAMADSVVYNNGYIGSISDSWTINLGFWVQDSFYLTSHTQLTGVDFTVLESQGDKMQTVDWQLLSTQPGVGLGLPTTINVNDTVLSTGGFGYQVDDISFTLPNLNLNGGTYWLRLSNATTRDQGNPVYWIENDGGGCTSPGCPSQALATTVGSIGSEVFDIRGIKLADGDTSAFNQSPEPSSLAIFGSGVVALAGRLRKRIRRAP